MVESPKDIELIIEADEKDEENSESSSESKKQEEALTLRRALRIVVWGGPASVESLMGRKVLRIVLGDHRAEEECGIAISTSLDQQLNYLVSQHHAALCMFMSPISVNVLRLMTSSDVVSEETFLLFTAFSLILVVVLIRTKKDPARLGKLIGGTTLVYVLVAMGLPGVKLPFSGYALTEIFL